jgi:hypothetical protein
MKPTPKLKLAQTRALWDAETTGDPEAPEQAAPARGREAPPDAARAAPRPDGPPRSAGEAAPDPQTARREAPPLDPAVEAFYPDGVPAPLNDAVAGVLDILWQNGSTIGPFDSPDCATVSCPRCGCQRAIEVREQGDAAVVSLRCSCGPTWFLQRFRHVKAFVEYAPAPLRRW